MHVTNSDQTHNTDLFLVWHRMYLRVFERELQEVDPSICLPYWRWDLDSQAMEASPILKPEWYGGSGQGDGQCVQDGVFANWQVQHPKPGCLRRKYAHGDSVGAMPATEQINRIVSAASSYQELRPDIEMSLHPYPHNQLGGHMASMASPSDPLFWLHHGLVDQIWWSWQQKKDDYATSLGGKLKSGESLTIEQRLPGLESARAQDVLDTKALCYDYEDLTMEQLEASMGGLGGSGGAGTEGGSSDSSPTHTIEATMGASSSAPGITPIREEMDHDTGRALLGMDDLPVGSTDRQDLTSIRHIDPVSDEFIAMNGWNTEEIRKREAQINSVTDRLNSLKGYISPSALWKRPDLVEKLSARVDHFVLHAPGGGKFSLSKNITEGQITTSLVREWKERLQRMGIRVEAPSADYMAELTKIIGSASYATSPNAAGSVASSKQAKSSSSIPPVPRQHSSIALLLGMTALFVMPW